MASVLCYIPGERVNDPELWSTLRAWQKSQNLNADKLRWTPDFLQPDSCQREELSAALTLLRQGGLQRVVFFEPRARALKDLDWLAFACTCQQLGIAVENAQGEVLLPKEQAETLQAMFLKASTTTTKSSTTAPASTKTRRQTRS